MKIAYFDRFEIELPAQAVLDCSHQGQCDEDVAHWQGKISLAHIDDDALVAELREYGAWDDEELADREANERRILWLAAGNIRDEDAVNS